MSSSHICLRPIPAYYRPHFVCTFLLATSLFGLMHDDCAAVKPDGTTKTTCTLKYYPSGASYWCMRVDPFEVDSFELTVTYDPTRSQLDTSFGNAGVLGKFPFTASVDVNPGNTLTVSGFTPTTSIGDV